MTAGLVVGIEAVPPERIVADLLVTSFFLGQRPLDGATGRADWRMCGMLSRQLAEGQLRGEAGEAILLPSRRRLAAPRVLLLGLGSRSGFNPARLREWAEDGTFRAVALGARRVAFAPLGEDASGISVEITAGAVLMGAVDGLRKRPAALHLRLAVDPAAQSRGSAALAQAARRGARTGLPVRLVDPRGDGVRPSRGSVPRESISPGAASPGFSSDA